MDNASKQLIAPCGLDCAGCDIRLVPTDAAAAQRVVEWFQEMGWLKKDEGVAEILQRSMYCQGCRGDRSVHWSADCEILTCCVDRKGLDFCYECSDFPCAELEKWATGGDHHVKAFAWLQLMRAGRQPESKPA